MTARGSHDPTFRPARDGLAKILGDLEAEVMECIWDNGPEPLSARDVEDAVGPARGVQYITLVTVLNNLWRKGLLKRSRSGRAFVYRPRLRREDFLRQVSRDVFLGVVELAPEAAVSSFIDILSELEPSELVRLKQMLNEHMKREREK
jgi:BlaI family transcriptional regulator, penicillinase repressor